MYLVHILVVNLNYSMPTSTISDLISKPLSLFKYRININICINSVDFACLYVHVLVVNSSVAVKHTTDLGLSLSLRMPEASVIINRLYLERHACSKILCEVPTVQNVCKRIITKTTDDWVDFFTLVPIKLTRCRLCSYFSSFRSSSLVILGFARPLPLCTVFALHNYLGRSIDLYISSVY